MKNLLIIIAAACFLHGTVATASAHTTRADSLAHAQNQAGETGQLNYIKTRVYTSTETGHEYQLHDYYDGLGYLTETLEGGYSPSGGDLVTLYEYDIHRRRTKTWLRAQGSGAMAYTPPAAAKTNAVEAYGDGTPFTESIYDAGPTGRLIAMFRAGDAFRSEGNEKYTGNDYGTNDLPIPMLRTDMASGTVDLSDSYRAGSLSAQTTTDEDGRVKVVYRDIEGKTVATCSGSGPERLETYYGYDAAARKVLVIPPAGVAALGGLADLSALSLDSDFVRNYCYLYRYDGYGNLRERRMPGSSTELLLYDGLQRLSRRYNGHYLMVAANTCVQFSELFGYDEQNRLKAVWIMNTSFNPAEYDPEEYLDMGLTDSVPTMRMVRFEPGCRYRYDDYGNIPAALAFSTAGGIERYDSRTKGLKTYERVRILPSDDKLNDIPEFTERAYYYDADGRILQTVEQNPWGGITRITSTYDLLGNVTRRIEQVQPERDALVDVLITEYDYDFAGRLIKENTWLNSSDTATTVYEYDELCRLRARIFGGITDRYAYNTQGWLTSRSNGYFSTALRYYDPDFATKPSFTGNIAEWEWSHGSTVPSAYAFEYDAHGRLADSRQYVNEQAEDKNVERDISYTQGGDIKTLKRYADGLLRDDYTFVYQGGRLVSVGDKTFSYDKFGNLTHDGLNGLEIKYNLHNLPVEIQSAEATITYACLYDGTKFTALDADGNGFLYAGSLVYKVKNWNTITLESAPFACGRIAATGKPASAYEIRYLLTDHLGSTRVVTDGTPEGTTHYDYYPFGLEWAQTSVPMSDNRYLYNGKEKQVLGGVNYLDYGARMYDPAIGRWITQDPLAELRPAVTPYHFNQNDPINRIDPSGMWDEDFYEDSEGSEETEDYYQLFRNGKVRKIKDTNDPLDILFASTNNNKMDENIATAVEKGILSELAKDKSVGDYKGTYAKMSNGGSALELFRFMAQNSDVEWGLGEFRNNFQVLFTSWQAHSVSRTGTETWTNGKVTSRTEFGFPLEFKISDTHSHRISSLPSVGDNKTQGDIPTARKEKKYNPDIMFKIYYVPDGRTIIFNPL